MLTSPKTPGRTGCKIGPGVQPGGTVHLAFAPNVTVSIRHRRDLQLPQTGCGLPNVMKVQLHPKLQHTIMCVRDDSNAVAEGSKRTFQPTTEKDAASYLQVIKIIVEKRAYPVIRYMTMP